MIPLENIKKNGKKPKVLLLAMTSYAGMGPYVASIINYFKDDDNIRYFVIEREDAYFSRNIIPSIKGIIKKEKTPSKLDTLFNIIFPFIDSYSNDILAYCKLENIEIVHALTSLGDVSLTKRLAKSYNLLYTIHDLHPHEAKKAFYKEWRQNVYYKRNFKAIDKVNYLLTNCYHQLNEQKVLYPQKCSFFAPFPSLVTQEIISGKMTPPELSGIENYILFFGRIEEYKGLSILVDAFLKSDFGNIKLVIAGKGEANIPKKNSKIIFINRYIRDEEIASLYQNASCVVYPYISATQSGVLSVASYFQIQIIASDIPFFKEVLGSDYPWLFENRNSDSLARCLANCLSASDSSLIKNMLSKLYMTKYSALSQHEILMQIYIDLMNMQTHAIGKE